MSVNLSAKFNRRAFLGLCLGALTSFAFGNASILRGRNLFVYYTRTLNTHILAHYMQGLIGAGICSKFKRSKPTRRTIKAVLPLLASKEHKAFYRL